MKVGLLSYSDSRGGAFAAAYRLHQGLVQVGTDSKMLVSEKTRDDFKVSAEKTKLAKGWMHVARTLDHLPLNFYRDRERTMYSVQWFPDSIASKAQLDLDVINLHWICNSYLSIETISKLNKPLVWTLHDMWAFTGGCHYNQDCNRYVSSCGACPQLHSHQNWDLSRWVWWRKAKAWKDIKLTIVTPSIWLAKCAISSSLFKDLRVEVIPYGLDVERYKPINKQIAREILGLPQDKQLILFGATSLNDSRKGFHLLQQSLHSLNQAKYHQQTELVVFGASEPKEKPNLGLRAHYLSKLSDDISLALVYAAADVFVVPSIQDNLPNTVMEALACGTPCVAFDIGGMPDMIEHQQNGYLVQPYKIEDLAQGISWVLENAERHQKLRNRAREKAEQEFTLELQAHRYVSLFAEIMRSDIRNKSH